MWCCLINKSGTLWNTQAINCIVAMMIKRKAKLTLIPVALMGNCSDSVLILVFSFILYQYRHEFPSKSRSHKMFLPRQHISIRYRNRLSTYNRINTEHQSLSEASSQLLVMHKAKQDRIPVPHVSFRPAYVAPSRFADTWSIMKQGVLARQPRVILWG